MKLFIDDGDPKTIEQLCEYYPIDGVTTNPSILARTKSDPLKTLKKIRKIIGEDRIVFAQAVALDYEGMIADAHMIVRLLGENTIVKIPSCETGFKAIRKLKQEGIKTCGTVVYTPLQAYLAAKAGASYVAPYVNRIDNMGYDGVAITMQIQDILRNNDLDCEVLAASFKNSQQVKELCEYGIDSVTCSPEVIRGFVKNAAIDQAIDDFVKDFKKLTGKTSMSELE
ncbi:MAG: fructose-6-phosphate aldolase [Erysipelotrichaceae bacterium]|nr:fructose-6-phosphate aldolase [Erysipelotrichaceae bacterium]